MTGAKVDRFQSTAGKTKAPTSKPVIGVYAIRCSSNGRSYVGSSKHVHARLRDHVNRLRRGKHPRAELQADFFEHGEACFVFEIILECRDEIEAVREEARLIGESFKAGSSYNGIVPNTADVRPRAIPTSRAKKNEAAQLKRKYLALTNKNRDESERLHKLSWDVMYNLSYRSAEQFFRCVDAFLKLTGMSDEDLSIQATGYSKRLLAMRRKAAAELTIAETGEIAARIRECMEDRDRKRILEEDAARKSWIDAERAAA